MKVYYTDDHVSSKHKFHKETLKKVIARTLVEAISDWWHMRTRYRVILSTPYIFSVGDEIVYSHYDENKNHEYRTGIVAKVLKRESSFSRVELEFVVLKSNSL